MKDSRTIYLATAAVIAALFVVSVVYYPFAPDHIVSHWNAAGVPDGFMSRFWGLFLLPVGTLGLVLLLHWIPAIDPLKSNIQQFRSHYDRFILVFAAYMLVVHLVVVLWNAGLEISFNIVPSILTGILFFYIGSFLGHTKRNWFIGIRTPWTLSSDAVWEQTHRLGGRLFKASGVIAALGAFFGTWWIYFLIVPIIVAVIWTMGYSYVAYRRVEDGRVTR